LNVDETFESWVVIASCWPTGRDVHRTIHKHRVEWLITVLERGLKVIGSSD
jgi:hypothetical protein